MNDPTLRMYPTLANSSFSGECSESPIALHEGFAPSVFGGVLCLVLTDALANQMWYRRDMNLLVHSFEMIQTVRRIYPEATLHLPSLHTIHMLKDCIVRMKVHADEIDFRFRSSLIKAIDTLLETDYFDVDAQQIVDKLASLGVMPSAVSADDPAQGGAALLINKSPKTVCRLKPHEGASYKLDTSYNWYAYDRWAFLLTFQPGMLVTSHKTAAVAFAVGNFFNLTAPYILLPGYDGHQLNV